MITKAPARRGLIETKKNLHAAVPRNHLEAPPIEEEVDLQAFSTGTYRPGNRLKRFLWMSFGRFFIETRLPWPTRLKANILRLFGAKIGKGIVIKPEVKIKYPWFLEVEDYSWIGERCWIDNSVTVKIGAHVVLSQGAFLVTGNHDYRSPSFDLRMGEIHIHRGAWIAAKAIVCPGVTVHQHAILCVGSTANRNLDAFGVYAGNPASKKRTRRIKSGA